MSIFADTSFFCSIYRRETRTEEAISLSEKHKRQIALSSLVAFEFRQSLRLQVRQHASDRTNGITRQEASRVLLNFQSDNQTGFFQMVSPDWVQVHALAEFLSAKHTESEGHRFSDILHVATALQLGMHSFLTFDTNQKKLALTEGLTVPV